MRKATKMDKKIIVDLLTLSFEDNKGVNYVILQDHKRKQRIASLMEYSFDLCYRFGEVFLSENNHGCALIYYPHKNKTTLASIWLDIKLIVNAVGFSGVRKTLDRESKIKAKRPKIPMTYLWFIGVNPLYQHQKTGSKLLQEVIEKAASDDLPVYLETSTLRNLPWYERLGFSKYNDLDLGYTLYFFSNERKQNGLC